MKIYLFNTETGVYLGEDFADEAFSRGESVLPSDATTIMPPLVAIGEFPVFNRTEQRWDVHQFRQYEGRRMTQCPE